MGRWSGSARGSRGIRHRISGRLRSAGRPLVIVCLAVAATQAAWGVVVPVLPLYAEEFGANATQLGLLIALFGVGRLVVNIPAGILCERLDPRRLLLWSVVAVVLLQVATAFAPTLDVLLGLRFAAGLAGGMAITSGMTLVVHLTRLADRGSAMSLLQGFQLIGGAFGPALGGLVATLWGYRAPFLACGVMAALVVTFGWRTLLRTASPGRTPSDPPASADADRAVRPQARSAVRRLLTDRSYLAICGVGFSIFLNRFAGTQSLVPIIAYTVVGLSVGQFGGLLGIVTFVNLIMVTIAGRLSDRIGRKRVIVPGLAMVGLALPAYAVTSDPLWFASVVLVTGVALGFSGPTPAAYMADVAPADGRGPAVGIYRTAGDLAAVVGPIGLGWIVDHVGYRSAVLVLATVTLLAVGVFAGIARETVSRPPVRSGGEPPPVGTPGMDESSSR
ncbi:MFS transporter [Actinopolymorpha sp. B17G11]|uniref:MFS transporter n=1 Tax=unclassified Actinopolymorpha TaxID=2627063 RepID=UPI0032D92BFB